MTVYIDTLKRTNPGPNWPFRSACHMVADTREELIAFAERIGLQRRWIQEQSIVHFDLNESRRREAVKAGAVEVSCRELFQVIRGKIVLPADRVPIRAISLWQPWATLMAIGAKRFETRSWGTTYRGDLVICASKRRLDVNDYEMIEEEPFASALDTELATGPLPLGCALAIVELRDVHAIHEAFIDQHISDDEYNFGNYGPGRFAWECTNIRRLPEPIPIRGYQGLFTLTPDTANQIRSATSIASNSPEVAAP